MKKSLISYFNTFESKERNNLLKVLDLAFDLHSDQEDRPDGAYINHILRVTSRIINDFEIKDISVIIASLLHDSIEDQSKKLSLLSGINEGGSEDALTYIKDNFGKEVSHIVFSVTNPKELDFLEPNERNKKYVEHIVHVIKEPKVFYVKFSDFLDNVLNIKNINDSERQKKLTKKYLPLYQVFIDRLNQEDIKIPKIKKQELEQKLITIKRSAENVI